jgi:hypothetical protein
MFIDLPSRYLFNGEANDYFLVAEKQLQKALEYNGRVVDLREDEKTSAERQEKIKKVKSELIELMADYGHTLRIKPEESILLNVNVGEYYIIVGQAKKSFTDFSLQFMKKDLDAYHQGSIKLVDLEKRLLK